MSTNFSRLAVTIEECCLLGKRLYPAKLEFTLTTPAGVFDASWLDPYFGIFLVPSLSGGAFNISSIDTHSCNCTELKVTPPGGKPEPYVGCGQQT
jgi:hypothetical protein